MIHRILELKNYVILKNTKKLASHKKANKQNEQSSWKFQVLCGQDERIESW